MGNKLYVPLSGSALNTQAIREAALEKLRQVDTDTVFLTWIDCYFSDDRSKEISLLRKNIEFFENAGLEVGVWIRSFGYGPPAGRRAIEATRNVTRIKSVVGNQMDTMDALCPESDDFMAFFRHFMADLMQARPKMIMLDDDMCLSVRPGIGCFCDRHMELLRRELGEELTGKPLEKLMFTGGRNRYRDAWLKVMGDTMRKFCRSVRDMVNTVDPTVRLGFCAGYTSWDVEGADALELTRILAGDTKPFLRLTGAPYWVAKDMRRFGGQRLNAIIEFARVQQEWCEDSGVEIFAEADSYPRNRHVMPASLINCFGMGVWANGKMGLENYFYDYVAPLDYEQGYHRNYLRHKNLREFVIRHFADKESTGVYVCEPMRKMKDWELPERFIGEAAVMDRAFSPAAALLTSHGVPVCYTENAECAAAFGQCVDALVAMPKKLILDAKAAQRLKNRGIDVGFTEMTPAGEPGIESFGEHCASVFNGAGNYYHLQLLPEAKVHSWFINDDDRYPAAYTYHNGETEFLVYAFDGYTLQQGGGVFLSNVRRMQLLNFVRGICCIDNHPGIYQLCKKGDGKVAILFENLHEDELFDFVIRLDRPYQKAEFCGIEAVLDGDRIYVSSSVAPYGMFAVVLSI